MQIILSQQRGAFVSEPAILVRRHNAGSQVWSMEKLENKLIDMRELYQEYKELSMAGLVSELNNKDALSILCIILYYIFHHRINPPPPHPVFLSNQRK